MSKEELQECISFIKAQALKLPNGTERDMYVGLFIWGSRFYDRKFKKSPRIFMMEQQLASSALDSFWHLLPMLQYR